MMKFLAMFSLLLLTNCAWFASHADQVQQIQEKAREICGFVPTYASTAEIISANNPTVTGVIAVAQAICTAITIKPPVVTLLQQECPKVNDVCVVGDYVEKKDSP